MIVKQTFPKWLSCFAWVSTVKLPFEYDGKPYETIVFFDGGSDEQYRDATLTGALERHNKLVSLLK